ncbi:flagellar M-ring protein FliF [Fontimonas thermophila]|uniref:Flagellar M-ring protein n=1 Tax=Fontimonas thermophila TaxID=1076937 RepID=A0A1I2IN75_9GAMM|nr:flagellar basal-body MS-ring/collar protein FliF [Fontimonas thermophila]SFF43714.1 flagellar M-ring protein FliF [Fontimonas thermophila]
MAQTAQMALPRFVQLKDVPALRQVTLLLGVAFAVALGLWGYRWAQQPVYAPLYSGLADRDAADVAAALRAVGVPFRYEPGSGVVSVPQDQLDQARLSLAEQGLPRSGGIGFEIMQQNQGFGTSQFIENARYQHALETELARTVTSLQPVRAARVHLAIPKPSAFARSEGTPSASVLVELHPGRQLEQSQVASIVHLVASSVAGMPASAVTVIDQYGRLLSNQGGDEGVARSAEQLEHTRRLESDYVRRIHELLAPMLGPGRVSAQVTADMDYSVTEEARETYNPDPAKLRSEQIVEDTTRGSKTAVGIPGATSNQPPQASANPPLNSAVATGDDVHNQSRQMIRNYELDRTVSHTRQSVGRIRRLSVAVLVDHVPRPKPGGNPGETEPVPLSAEELAKVEALVREAVGFNAQRGDSVSVQNAPFVAAELSAPEPLPFWQQPQMREILRQIGGAMLVLVLILFVLRPALRSLLTAPVGVPSAKALPGAIDAGAVQVLGENSPASGHAPAALPAQNSYEQKLQIARSAVVQDPKRVAQVVKNWVAQEG